MAPPVQRLPGWTVGTIGESVEGRPIERIDTRPERPGRHVVVICGMHGNERAAVDLGDGFGRINRPDDLHLTLVPLLNPDGWAAGTRNNGRDVDLNRNFSWGWPRRPGSGSGPASEPETKAAMSFLETTRPDLVVWVHQPLNYVAAIRGCPKWYADIWSDVAEVPVRRNLAQIGGGETWAGHELGIPSMLVEVGGTRTEPIGVAAHVAALEALIFAVQPT
jgi:protein MpaA